MCGHVQLMELTLVSFIQIVQHNLVFSIVDGPDAVFQEENYSEVPS